MPVTALRRHPAAALAAVLLASAAVAAPVPPPNPDNDRVRLEALWTALASDDPVARTKAAFALADHPAAVPFLAEKAPPVKATADRLTGWLKELNSDEDKVWKPAFERLRYFDPKLALTPAEQIECVNTDHGQRLLAFLRAVAEIQPDVWHRAALAAVILDRIDTKASRELISKLASGRADTLPTRTASSLMRQKFALPSLLPDPDWAKLLASDPVTTTRWAFELADHPERVKALKARLPAIRATKEEVTGWLKALDSEKPEEWKPAFETLLYFRPSLALGLEEQCDLMTTDHGRSALYALYALGPRCSAPPDELVVHPNSRLLASREMLTLVSRPENGRGRVLPESPSPLAELDPPHWRRARVAILALERANTPAARAVLAQLADGHPDILPTKEAKAALERLRK